MCQLCLRPAIGLLSACCRWLGGLLSACMQWISKSPNLDQFVHFRTKLNPSFDRLFDFNVFFASSVRVSLSPSIPFFLESHARDCILCYVGLCVCLSVLLSSWLSVPFAISPLSCLCLSVRSSIWSSDSDLCLKFCLSRCLSVYVCFTFSHILPFTTLSGVQGIRTTAKPHMNA